MPYTHDWYNKDKAIIQWNMLGEADWPQFHDSVNAVCTTIAEAPQRVDIIVLDEAGLPGGNPLPHMKRAFTKLNSEENLGEIVLVANRSLSALIKPMTTIAAKIANLHFPLKFATSVEEALAVIERNREKVQ